MESNNLTRISEDLQLRKLSTVYRIISGQDWSNRQFGSKREQHRLWRNPWI